MVLKQLEIALSKKFRSVFDVYGNKVKYRHLRIVADYMTYSGAYRPFNKIGMGDNNSPFLKASFKTSTSFLTDA